MRVWIVLKDPIFSCDYTDIKGVFGSHQAALDYMKKHEYLYLWSDEGEVVE